MELTWEDRIIKARLQMKSRYPMFWWMAMHLEPVEVHDVLYPWATDGKHLFYCPERLDEGGWADNDEFIMTGLAHEVWHPVAHHVGDTRKQGRVHTLWMIATDMETNHVLRTAGFQFSPKCLGIPGKEGPAEEHYDELLNELEKDIQEKLGKLWDEIKDPPGEQADGQGQAIPGDDKDEADDKVGTPKSQDNQGDQNGPDQSSQGSQGDQDSPNQGNPDWDRIMAEAQMYAKMVESENTQHGTLSGDLEEAIKRAQSARADWRKIISGFFSRLQRSRFTYEKPNRRFVHRGIYLPGPKKEVATVILVLDSSGSMDNEQIAQCLAEMWVVGHRFPRLKLLILVVDSNIKYICRHPSEIKVRGRGGTSFKPAFEYVEEHNLQPAGMIYFTDLEGDFPDQAPRYPVIWAATKDHPIPFGKKVLIPIGNRRTK